MNARARRTAARLGLLATTLALAVALGVGSWLNYRAAQSAESTLVRGQADVFAAALRDAIHTSAEPDTTVLRELLDRYADDGLRYIALVEPRRDVMIDVGEPIAPITPPSRDSVPGTLPLVSVGDRVRTFLPVARGRPAPIRPRDRDDPGRRSFEFRRRGVYLSVLEFEPVVASTLVSGAATSMILAGVAATILALAALLFWRTSERYDRALLRLEEQKRLTVLGEMSAVLAHEMRNPLASLKGHAQLLAERLPPDSRERAKAGRVIGEAARLEALTSDLLDFARAGPLEMQQVDPAGLMRTSVADVADDAFELDVDTAPDRWTVDAPRVRQALVNLLENARRVTANGQLVPSASVDREPGGPAGPGADERCRPQARVVQENGQLVFEVRDFGPGLPSGSETRIFDPFFTTRTNGTGLGLAVARRVAELHGGRITAHNHPDGGAVFRLELPRKQES